MENLLDSTPNPMCEFLLVDPPQVGEPLVVSNTYNLESVVSVLHCGSELGPLLVEPKAPCVDPLKSFELFSLFVFDCEDQEFVWYCDPSLTVGKCDCEQ